MSKITLKEYREKAGYTQERLARETDVSVFSISKYETSGIDNAKFDTVKKICEILNADIRRIV